MSTTRRVSILVGGAVLLLVVAWLLNTGSPIRESSDVASSVVEQFEPTDVDVDVESPADGAPGPPGYDENAREVVSGDFTGQLTGSAVDSESGRPVTQFSISLFADGRLDVSNHADFNAEFSSTDGSFTISGLEVGVFDILARASRYQPVILRGIEIGARAQDVTFNFETGRRISGRVLDGITEDAVAGARVTAGIITDGTSRVRRIPLPGQSAITDNDGQFVLDEIPHGKGRLWAGADGYATSPTEFGDESTIDIVIRLDAASFVAGRIVDVDGSAVAGGSIYMVREEPATSWRRRADENGDFRVRKLPPGQFVLTASSPAGRSAPVEITLSAGDRLEDLVLQIIQGHEVNGQVSGLLDGERIRYVTARRLDNPTPSFPDEMYADVDDTGFYNLDGLPSGHYRIRAITTTGRSLSRTIEATNRSTTFIDFVFVGSASVEGRVFWGGEPLNGIPVEFRPVNTSHPRGNVRTDSDGYYRVQGLANGQYEVKVWYPNTEAKVINVSGSQRYDVSLD